MTVSELVAILSSLKNADNVEILVEMDIGNGPEPVAIEGLRVEYLSAEIHRVVIR